MHEQSSEHTRELLAMLPAFGPGVHLMSPEGEIPIEWLATGDRVLTRDHGAQPVLWLHRFRIGNAATRSDPALRPLEVQAGVLGEGLPSHPTQLSPAHRVLLAGPMVDLHTGTNEALARLIDLAGDGIVGRAAAGATHFTLVLLDVPAIVQANGLWVQSLHLDLPALRLLAGDIPGPILTAPLLRQHRQSARLCLADWETCAIRAASGTGLAEMIRNVA